MKFILIALSCCFVACSKSKPRHPKHLPDNVLNDSPILIGEGQIIRFKMKNDLNLLVCAMVIDGELTVCDFDGNSGGKKFEVRWKDTENWRCSTEFPEGDKIVTIVDLNGDGTADFMTKGTPADKRKGLPIDMVGFNAKPQEWKMIDQNKNFDK
jgi:hypothetical protein